MLLPSLKKANIMDKISKGMIIIGLPVMIIGFVLMFNILNIEALTFPGVALTLVGAALAWIGFARAKGLVT